MKKNLLILFFIFALLPLFSCTKKEQEQSAEYNYIEAMKLLKSNRYEEAADKFDKMLDEHPFSKWSVKGQVMAIYCYYENKDYDVVVDNAENFISDNPAHPDIPYVYYLKAMAYYNNIPDISRGQDQTQLASYSFRELIARFPETDYAEDARGRLALVDEHLAGAKMQIARYLMTNANYVGAILNLNNVIVAHKNTEQIPEAYFRLAEIYSRIGMRDEAQKAILTLQNLDEKSEWQNKIINN